MATQQLDLPAIQPSVPALTQAQALGVLSLVYPDAWAQELGLAVDGHPFTVRGREYEVDIMRDEHPYIIIPKGAQLGLTTTFLVRSFHWIIKRRWHHLYLLPFKAGAIPFVQGRVDPILASNPELGNQFKAVDNRLHKQTIDDIAFRIRGTNIWTELREIPADVLVIDERDKAVEDNLPEAFARLHGSKVKRVVELSTPTAPGHGVDSEESWHASDKHRWWVPCPHCSRYQVINFRESVEPWMGDKLEDCRVRCQSCKMVITDDERAAANEFGVWEPEEMGAEKRGYHLSQFASPTMAVKEIMEGFYIGLKEPKKMRAFFNNNLGEPYVALGDQITKEMLDKCRVPGMTLGGIPDGPPRIGVDIGHSFLHMVARVPTRDGGWRLWDARIFKDFDELDNYLESLSNFLCVIDAHPEKRAAERLSIKWDGRVWMGFEKDSPQQAETAAYGPDKWGDVRKVNIDRTMALDQVINDYMLGRMKLPMNADELGEYYPNYAYNGFYHHQMQMVRIEEEDTHGRIIARWAKNKNPDHWHHAMLFSWAATMYDVPMVVSADVQAVLAKSGGFFAT